MAANFSGAVKLADLNDFIAPSQACVVNLNSNKTAQLALEDDLQVDAVQLQPKASKGFSQTQLAGPTDAIKVTLHDCLACSGCITSAETVLLEHQSVDELLANLAQPDVTVIVSLSPQSRASLAAFYKLTPTQAVKRLTHFFKSLGVKYVFDTSCSRDLALLETAHEFIHRYHTRHRGATDLASAAGASSSDMDIDGDRSAAEPHSNGRTAPEANGTSSNGVHFGAESALHALGSGRGPGDAHANGGGSHEHANSTPPARASSSSQQHRTPETAATAAAAAAGWGPADEGCILPMLASACPGWVCYAEKTHGEYILPYISTAKSPQAVMGSIVKQHLCPQLGLAPGKVYHCAVMPCYDKKLEASRDDFNVPGTPIPEVDSVLTSSEVQLLLEARGADLAAMPDAPLDSMLSSVGPDGQLYGVSGGSGGYLEFTFRTAAKQLFGQELPPGPLDMRPPHTMRTRRNTDFREVSLEAGGATVLRFATVYGFNNIQRLIRQIKGNTCGYDYVEVMACPSGCLNGGGQVKPVKGQTAQKLIEELEVLYHHAEVEMRHPLENPTVRQLYEQWVQAGCFSQHARRLLHTQYHHRKQTVTASLKDW